MPRKAPKTQKSPSVGHAAHMKTRQTLGVFDAVRRPLKIAFLGAGSTFAKHLFADVLNIPGAERGEFALVDVDPVRLRLSASVCRKVNKALGLGWRVTTTARRREALDGADYVINCIEVNGPDCIEIEYDIPARYGVDQCIGDTLGPGGLFKALRTAPVWLDVLKDVERLCPDAWVLNYTNPMSILCLAAHRAGARRVVGLCHSIQGTSHQLAGYAGVPYEEMRWRCAGINHMAWFTELTHEGRDLYPVLRRRLREDKTLLAQDPVRFDMMLHFGPFMTETSGHLSEYLPYYRKRPELIERHCGEGYQGEPRFYADNWPGWRQALDAQRRRQIAGKEPLVTERSWEYASYIVEAMETNRPCRVHATVPNTGLIENLPGDGAVEVACLVDANGVQATHFGRLPAQCAAVCDSNMRMIDLAATACVERDLGAAEHALLVDPLTMAVCSPSEIRKMFRELARAEKRFLTSY